MSALQYLTNFKFIYDDWDFIDLRIDIPAKSYGSDAINKHTQYSNPVARISQRDGDDSFGVGFTLGEGNQIICEIADLLIKKWHGESIATLKDEGQSPYDFLSNPDQIRWLSPNSGAVYQAVGLIINTILDAYCRDFRLPLWRALLAIGVDDFNQFFGALNNLSSQLLLDERNESEIKMHDFLKAYHTTWIGFDARSLSEEILKVHKEKGIKLFKIKIGADVDSYINKLKVLRTMIPEEIELAVDANQVLTLSDAKKYLLVLDEMRIKWLEEPFSPDNILLFKKLIEFKRSNLLAIEIVTGENCPSPHVCEALLEIGIDRYQADPCRMMGFVDIILVSHLCDLYKTDLTPHAGGSCLDELSNHIAHYHHARTRYVYSDNAYIENVGFCSWLLKNHTLVKKGVIITPTSNILLGDFKPSVSKKFKTYNKGTTWLEL
jgi:L-alanine-DL-glutamate epimerase-like enolase superfamily enzyme